MQNERTIIITLKSPDAPDWLLNEMQGHFGERLGSRCDNLAQEFTRVIADRLSELPNGVNVSYEVLSLRPAPQNAEVLMDFTNYKGIRSIRRIRPIRMFWGSTTFHRQDQFFIKAYDLEKNGEIRDFPLKGIHSFAPLNRTPELDPFVCKHCGMTYSHHDKDTLCPRGEVGIKFEPRDEDLQEFTNLQHVGKLQVVNDIPGAPLVHRALANAVEVDEEELRTAFGIFLSEQRASVSLLQRRQRWGYVKSARIVDVLEARGYVSPSKGSEPREILREAWQEVAK